VKTIKQREESSLQSEKCWTGYAVKKETLQDPDHFSGCLAKGGGIGVGEQAKCRWWRWRDKIQGWWSLPSWAF